LHANETVLELRFPARAERLKKVRAAVHEAATRSGCTPACAHDIMMAVDEACQNIIRHAYGGDSDSEIVLRIERHDDQLVLLLRDFAEKVDERRVEPRPLDELRPGGLGVHIIREVMDECGFVPAPSGVGNLYRMAIRIR